MPYTGTKDCGVALWSAAEDYTVPALVYGADNRLYEAVEASGPGTTTVGPCDPLAPPLAGAPSLGAMVAAVNPLAPSFLGLAAGLGLFVATSTQITDKVYYSTDGVSWNESTLPSAAEWRCLAFGGDRFVAIGRNRNTAAVSLDGVNWTASALPATAAWYCLGWHEGLFVATANASNRLIYSADGFNWTETVLPLASTWRGFCSGGGTVVLTAQNSADVLYSTDGINWQLAAMPVSSAWLSVAYGEGIFVNLVYGRRLTYSSDGINWQQGAPIMSVNGWQRVAFGDGMFLAINSNYPLAAWSVDGMTWVEMPSGVGQTWSNVVYGNGRFVAVASDGNTVISVPLIAGSGSPREIWKLALPEAVTEADLEAFILDFNQRHQIINQTQLLAATSHQTVDTWSPGKDYRVPELVFGSDYELYKSLLPSGPGTADGPKDPLAPVVSVVPMTSVVYNTSFNVPGYLCEFAVSDNGIIVGLVYEATSLTDDTYRVVSKDAGRTWAHIVENNMESHTALYTVYGNGIFMSDVCGYGSFSGTHPDILISSDGETWTRKKLPVTNSSSDPTSCSLAYGNGLFMHSTVGFDAVYHISANNGDTWSLVTRPNSNSRVHVGYIYFAGDYFWAPVSSVGAYGTSSTLYMSTDGRNWRLINPGIPNNAYITFRNGKYYASSGSALPTAVSDDAINWNPIDVWDWQADLLQRGEDMLYDRIVSINDAFIVVSNTKVYVSASFEGWDLIVDNPCPYSDPSNNGQTYTPNWYPTAVTVKDGILLVYPGLSVIQKITMGQQQSVLPSQHWRPVCNCVK